MGIKLEYILIIILLVTIFMTTTVKLTSSMGKIQTANKDLEFINTTFTEVDTQKMQAKLYSPYGVRKSDVLMLDNVNYNTPNIKSLLADKASYSNNILNLDGNVTLTETIGYIYKTEHAMYNQKEEILTITSPFVAYMDKNIFRGNTLIYNAITKEANATKIDAIVYPTEK